MMKLRWQYLIVLLLGIVIGVYLSQTWPAQSAEAKLVTVISRGVHYSILSEASDVQGVLTEQGLPTLGAQVQPQPRSPLVWGMRVYYRGPVQIELIDGVVGQAVTSSAATVAEFFQEGGIVLGPKDEVAPSLDSLLADGMRIIITRVEEVEKTEIEPVAFKTRIEEDPEALYGRQELVREGQLGRQEVLYKVRLKNGREASRNKISTEILEAPVDEVVRVGRKVVVEAYELGRASWYATKKCLLARQSMPEAYVGGCAAHPHYPMGSFLQVTHLTSGKSVIVRVNDRGPNQQVHQGRLLDLDAEAFKLLAPLSLGTIEVRVEKLKSE